MDQANQVPMQEAPKKSVGPLVGIIIIIIVLVIGALYFWGMQTVKNESFPEIPAVAPLSASDELQDISADLSATVIDGVDSDLRAIDGVINQ